MLRSPIQVTAALFLAFLVNPVQAQKTWPHMPTPSEIAMMPDYCQAKMGTNEALRQQWNQRMGPDKFLHLHHYCHGLKQMNRYKLTFDAQQRRFILQTAIGEFDYVVRNWPDDFYLKAEAKSQKAKAEARLLQP
jgi:hypothetical protein